MVLFLACFLLLQVSVLNTDQLPRQARDKHKNEKRMSPQKLGTVFSFFRFTPNHQELAMVWPAMRKMKQRDVKYAAERVRCFTTEVGRRYFRELSVDELPGKTTTERLAICLCLCECMDMRAQYVAPAFGFQKNFPYLNGAPGSNDELKVSREPFFVSSQLPFSVQKKRLLKPDRLGTNANNTRPRNTESVSRLTFHVSRLTFRTSGYDLGRVRRLRKVFGLDWLPLGLRQVGRELRGVWRVHRGQS